MKIRRNGFTLFEVLIAMSLLLVVMNFCGKLIYRTDLIWRQTTRHRVAMDELINQMQQLTLLTTTDLRERINSLSPSDHCQRILNDARLRSAITTDELGTRVSLTLRWSDSSRPAELTGWLVASKNEPPADSNQEDEE